MLHGICYAFFFATVYIFVDEFFPKDIRSSAQGLFNVLILGRRPDRGQLRLRPTSRSITRCPRASSTSSSIFVVPMSAALVAAALLLLFFHPPKPANRPDADPGPGALMPSFRPLPLLGNPHVQTVLGALLRGKICPRPQARHVVALPDGDALLAAREPARRLAAGRCRWRCSSTA